MAVMTAQFLFLVSDKYEMAMVARIHRHMPLLSSHRRRGSTVQSVVTAASRRLSRLARSGWQSGVEVDYNTTNVIKGSGGQRMTAAQSPPPTVMPLKIPMTSLCAQGMNRLNRHGDSRRGVERGTLRTRKSGETAVVRPKSPVLRRKRAHKNLRRLSAAMA
jgi:hypothetical protein